MSDRDKELIDRARSLSRYSYDRIDDLIEQAESDETIQVLNQIRDEKREAVIDTL